jgi:hypothetical protein
MHQKRSVYDTSSSTCKLDYNAVGLSVEARGSTCHITALYLLSHWASRPNWIEIWKRTRAIEILYQKRLQGQHAIVKRVARLPSDD